MLFEILVFIWSGKSSHSLNFVCNYFFVSSLFLGNLWDLVMEGVNSSSLRGSSPKKMTVPTITQVRVVMFSITYVYENNIELGASTGLLS